jgi:hypothetical protein
MLFKSICSKFCCFGHRPDNTVSNIFIGPSIHPVARNIPDQRIAINDPEVDSFLRNVVDHLSDENTCLLSLFEELSNKKSFWPNVILSIVNQAKDTKSLWAFNVAIKRLPWNVPAQGVVYKVATPLRKPLTGTFSLLLKC